MSTVRQTIQQIARPCVREVTGNGVSGGSGGGEIWATVTSSVGSPTLHEDVDGDGLWDAYEFTATGSITLTAGKIGRRCWQAGGGSGGNGNRAGSGGGGGWTERSDAQPTVEAGTFAITIGAGGASNALGNGNTGSDTTAFSTNAPGGGFGAGRSTGGGLSNGGDGGNGGGGGTSNTELTALGGVGDPGFDGGSVSEAFRAAGGGGSGSRGQHNSEGGDGGSGVSSDILGSSETFGAGGNKNGGGGDAPSPVTANRGAGSGGALNADTIAGADGCFIVRIRR